jgi:hypothetical protein
MVHCSSTYIGSISESMGIENHAGFHISPKEENTLEKAKPKLGLRGKAFSGYARSGEFPRGLTSGFQHAGGLRKQKPVNTSGGVLGNSSSSSLILG